MAKSIYWNKLMKDGKYNSGREIAIAHNHNIEYVKRALRQKYLSPRILEEIVGYKNTSQNDERKNTQISLEKLYNTSYWCWRQQEQTILKSI